MPELTTESIKLNDYIQFKTMNPADLNHWEGRVISLCGYEEAIAQQDILPYYWETQKSIKILPIPEELRYFKLKILENENTSKKTYRIFALEYIDVSTLRINNFRNDITARIYGVEPTEVTSILLLLHSHGYTAKIIPNS